MAFTDFGPVSGSEAGARNGQERVECGPERAERLTGAVRRLPQDPPNNTREPARSDKKNPNRERLVFQIVVELGGFEPPSANLPRADLHV